MFNNNNNNNNNNPANNPNQLHVHPFHVNPLLLSLGNMQQGPVRLFEAPTPGSIDQFLRELELEASSSVSIVPTVKRNDRSPC